METPVVMLLNVILWSFGISAAILVSLIWLDDLAARGERLANQHRRPLPGAPAKVVHDAPRHRTHEAAAKAA